METNPQEIELNFDGNSKQDLDELEAARMELSEELNSPAIAEEESVYMPEAEIAADTAELENTSSFRRQDKAAVNTADTEILVRSRQPSNRPAGTPPLESHPHEEPLTAMEMVVAGKSYGTALRILREQHNMSYKELEQITLIQPRYLEALENENLKALPPLVYVIGFIKTLCRFYKLNSDTAQSLVAKLKEQLEYSCNDELMNTLDVDRSGAAANEKRLKNIMMGMTGGALSIIVLIVLLVVLFRGGCSSTSSTPSAKTVVTGNSKFDFAKIDKLLPQPELKVPKLPVAE